jgi:glutaminase
VDAQVTHPAKGKIVARNAGYANESPLQRFLTGCYEEFKSDDSGEVADYIPELQRANPAHFGEQALLADLEPDEIAALAELSTALRYEAGQRIISAGEPANSVFFVQSGMVSVKLPSGVRLASLGPGMEFGEMAIIEQQRSTDVWADTPVTCLELPLDSFADYRQLHPQIAMKIMRNLSALLARRLIIAYTKVDLLSAY